MQFFEVSSGVPRSPESKHCCEQQATFTSECSWADCWLHNTMKYSFLKKLKINIFIWLCQASVVAHRIFDFCCGIQELRHAEFSSLTEGQTWASCIASTVSATGLPVERAVLEMSLNAWQIIHGAQIEVQLLTIQSP